MRTSGRSWFISCCLGVLLAAAWFHAGATTHGYFEHRYFCQVADNSITVSIQSGQKYCFTYIDEIHQKLQQINADITIATDHIDTGEDVTYWREVRGGLFTEKEKLDKLRKQLVAAIDDYEADLFRRVKVILAYYLKDEKESVAQQLKQADKLLEQFKEMGDRERFIEVQSQVDALTHRFNLLQAVRDATRFSELISPLKEYMRLHKQTDAL